MHSLLDEGTFCPDNPPSISKSKNLHTTTPAKLKALDFHLCWGPPTKQARPCVLTIVSPPPGGTQSKRGRATWTHCTKCLYNGIMVTWCLCAFRQGHIVSQIWYILILFLLRSQRLDRSDIPFEKYLSPSLQQDKHHQLVVCLVTLCTHGGEPGLRFCFKKCWELLWWYPRCSKYLQIWPMVYVLSQCHVTY